MAKACGKIILAGEHAVVYGYPAIAMTIDLEVRVSVTHVFSPGAILQNAAWIPAQARDAISRKLVELLGDRVTQLQCQIESDIPGRCGLGSSAALSVALIRGILNFWNESRSASQIASMALELEKIFHGNPSGVDHTVIVQEGLIWFQAGCSEAIVPKVPLSFVIAVASAHAGTFEAVQSVKRLRETKPLETQKNFESICEITHNMRTAIESGNLTQVGLLLSQNQMFLKNLGVSTPELDFLCDFSIEQGALGAKLTGAGGGGSVIALVPEPRSQLLNAFRKAGYHAF